MKAKGKKYVAIGVAAAVIVAVIVIVTCVCFHEWKDATCEEPVTCEKCGKTQGEPLGHKWIEATCTEAKHCSVCEKTEGQPLGHEWIEATCTEPKHCMVCGEEQGSTIEHSWKDATCEDAKVCSACGKIDGEPLGHSVKEWTTTKETSCSSEGERSGICDRCKKECVESIEKLPHNEGEWTVIKDFVFRSDGTVTPGMEATVCTVCGEQISTREYTVELTLSQKNAVIAAYDEINFWHCGPSFLANDILADFNDFPIEDAKFAVAHMSIDWDEQAVLYAQENSSGASKAGLTNEMQYYGFSSAQIENALKEVGY